jgi:phosphoribosylamine--glycine ligase
VYVANGNGGTTWEENNGEGFLPLAPCDNVAIAPDNLAGLLAFAKENAIGLTVVGPEIPLAMGIVDLFQTAGLRIFGAHARAARLEASKAFSKAFMRQHNIPTAECFITSDYEEAVRYIRAQNAPLVVKADGLAAGKGVIVCDTPEEAIEAAATMLNARAFGEAGATILIEERLEGREFSVLAFCDGTKARLMPVARDHKRALDGDMGGNTGGMGAFAPADDIPQALIDEVQARVIQPTLDGMASANAHYVGVLYAGLMLTPKGIMTLEFNCRFGDPETQVILPLLETDLVDVCIACIDGALVGLPIVWREGYSACVVLASEGYPNDYPKGRVIVGVDEASARASHGVVFHAGTARQGDALVTNGGRVLNVTAYHHTLAQALQDAYAMIDAIHFDGMHYRKDIGTSTRKQNDV